MTDLLFLMISSYRRYFFKVSFFPAYVARKLSLDESISLDMDPNAPFLKPHVSIRSPPSPTEIYELEPNKYLTIGRGIVSSLPDYISREQFKVLFTQGTVLIWNVGRNNFYLQSTCENTGYHKILLSGRTKISTETAHIVSIGDVITLGNDYDIIFFNGILQYFSE